MIAKFTRRSRGWAFVAATLTAALGCAALTDGVNGQAKPAPATAPQAMAQSSSPANHANFLVPAPAKEGDPYQRMLDRLHSTVPEVNFQAIPLGDVIDYLRDVTNENIVVNAKALEGAGIDIKTPITLRLRDVTLAQLLGHLCREAGGGSVQVSFSVDPNTITISTAEDAARNTIVRTYNVRALANSATTQPAEQGYARALESLKQVIEDHVEPDSWRDSGGTVGSISIFGDTLIIQTTLMNHEEIARLLDQLSAAQTPKGTTQPLKEYSGGS